MCANGMVMRPGEHDTVEGQDRDRILNAFSVDVEEYFQVAAFESVVARNDWHGLESRVAPSVERLLSLLDEHQVKATLFFLGWVAERHPRLLLEAASQGHELAVHGYDHRRVTTLEPHEFREDIRRSKAIIESASSAESIGYRAPTYSIVSRVPARSSTLSV